MITALEIVEMPSGEVIHTVPLDPPLSPDSTKLERIMSGMLTNLRDDCFIREVEDDS